jgi:hypothetical protein
MFIDEWFDQAFYQKLPLDYAKNLRFGQFGLTHAYYPHENLQLWRPVAKPSAPAKSIASEFQLVSAPGDSFARQYPLEAPKLATNEEFIAIRAKKRPIVLLHVPSTSLAGVSNKGFSGKVVRNLCVAAQVFGLADSKTSKPAFSSTFIDRVRKMEFPELLFLPKEAGLFQVDSLLRLDELQSVFMGHIEASQYGLGPDVLDVLRGQIQTVFSGPTKNYYSDLREELLKG